MEEKKKEDISIEMLDRQPNGHFDVSPKPAVPPSIASITSNPSLSILAYCASSILMTVTNKYVLSGTNFNMNFVLLIIQNTVCIVAIQSFKTAGIITYRDFNTDEARKWFPISLLLIGMIYTGSKSLQFLSIPVYTIFKNLTIILIAYGMTLLSFGLMVVSSIIAAWADIQHALYAYSGDSQGGEAAAKISTLNAGYLWMMCNCFCSAAYILGVRKRIKLTNFKDFDSEFYTYSIARILANYMPAATYYNNLLSIPILLLCSLFLENWSSENLALNFPPAHRITIFVTMMISGLSSVFISYTSAWCVRVTSSTTYSMVGMLNKLPIALSGLIFFDAPVTLASVSAIFIGFVSGIVYAIAKVWQGKAKAQQPGILPTTSASVQSMRDSLKS